MHYPAALRISITYSDASVETINVPTRCTVPLVVGSTFGGVTLGAYAVDGGEIVNQESGCVATAPVATNANPKAKSGKHSGSKFGLLAQTHKRSMAVTVGVVACVVLVAGVLIQRHRLEGGYTGVTESDVLEAAAVSEASPLFAASAYHDDVCV